MSCHRHKSNRIRRNDIALLRTALNTYLCITIFNGDSRSAPLNIVTPLCTYFIKTKSTPLHKMSPTTPMTDDVGIITSTHNSILLMEIPWSLQESGKKSIRFRKPLPVLADQSNQNRFWLIKIIHTLFIICSPNISNISGEVEDWGWEQSYVSFRVLPRCHEPETLS